MHIGFPLAASASKVYAQCFRNIFTTAWIWLRSWNLPFEMSQATWHYASIVLVGFITYTVQKSQ